MNDPVLQVLRERFGLEAFRGRQRAVIDHVLAGRDALVVMPTGSGKSLLYQVPALVLPGRTVVLSPLIALMKDQVDQLQALGIPASFVNSSLPRAERERRTRRFVQGEIQLLYVTPERFRSPPFREAMRGVVVSLLAVDEAHCASEWGHDFRPDYSRIADIRRFLGEPPTLALTATATPDVQREVRDLIGIEDATLFHTGIERPNLFLACTEWLDESEKWRHLLQRQRRLPGSGIVYGTLIKDLHRLEDVLARSGRPCLVYHGGLAPDERRSMQDRFMGGIDTRVLATPAFGMGVDKSDVRSILHHQIPGSVEAYTQEVGRAGRDEKPAFCELLYCEEDLAIQTQFVQWANPDAQMLRQVALVMAEWGADTPHYGPEDLRVKLGVRDRRDGRIDTCLQWLTVLGVLEGSFERRDLRLIRPLEDSEIPDAFDPDKKRRDLERLLRLVQFIRSERCRRVWLHEYFGLDVGEDSCGACDRCVDAEDWLERNMPPPGPGQESGSEGPVPDDTAVRRGDFVRVDGRHLGRVVRVRSRDRGRGLEIEVELSTDLRVRRFRTPKNRVEILEPEE